MPFANRLLTAVGLILYFLMFIPNATFYKAPDGKRQVNRVNFLIRSDICRHASLLFVVHSAISHVKVRKSIRETWGSSKNFGGYATSTVFVLGKSLTDTTNQKIVRESQTYGDIVQGDFIDSYENLTTKHYMGLQYSSEECQHVKYVIKLDDDVFVDVLQLVKYLDVIRIRNTDNYIHCDVLENEKVHREPEHKLSVTLEEYPGDLLPPFCMGMAVIYPKHIVDKLVYAARQAVLLRKLDDVYFGGILPQKLGIHLRQMPGLYSETGTNTKEWLQSNDFRPPWFIFALVWHRPSGGMQAIARKINYIYSIS